MRSPAAIREAKARASVLMVTAVWGDWHINAHFSVNLPSLLSANNLPAFAAHHALSYEIHTRQADVDRVVNSPAYRRLRELMNVSIHLIADSDLDDPIAAHHKVWSRAMERAKRAGQYALLMPPDVAWSDGSFRHVAGLLSAGKKAILMTYLRVLGDSFIRDFVQSPAAEDKGITGQELVFLALRHVHPLMAAYMRDSPYFPIHKEMMLWPVKGEGVLVRVFAREMFLFDPRTFERNYCQLIGNSFRPSDVHFVSDSDDLFAVSLAPPGKDVAWHLDRRAADPHEIGQWWLMYDSPANDFVASHKIRWHFAPATEQRWRARERGSDLLVYRAAIAREQQRVLDALTKVPDCSVIGSILSAAIKARIVEPPRFSRGRALVLAPQNSAIADAPPPIRDVLGTVLDRDFLDECLRRHIGVWDRDGDNVPSEDMTLHRFWSMLPFTLSDAGGQTWTVKGNRVSGDLVVETSLGLRAKVTQGPTTVGRHVICVIDRLLLGGK